MGKISPNRLILRSLSLNDLLEEKPIIELITATTNTKSTK